MPKHSTPLTDKEAAFVREFLVCRNRHKAALAAGYSARSAARLGSEVASRPHVAAAIDAELKKQERRTLITADANLRRLDRLASRAEVEGDLGAAVNASVWIGKHYKSFTDRLDVRDITPRADRLAAARARRQQQDGAGE